MTAPDTTPPEEVAPDVPQETAAPEAAPEAAPPTEAASASEPVAEASVAEAPPVEVAVQVDAPAVESVDPVPASVGAGVEGDVPAPLAEPSRDEFSGERFLEGPVSYHDDLLPALVNDANTKHG